MIGFFLFGGCFLFVSFFLSLDVFSVLVVVFLSGGCFFSWVISPDNN